MTFEGDIECGIFFLFMTDSKKKTYQNQFFQNAKMFLRQTVSRQSEPRQNVSLPLIRQSVSRQSRHDAKVFHAKVFHMSKW